MKLLSRCAGSTRAAPATTRPRGGTDLIEKDLEGVRSTRNGGRTEGRHAVPRQRTRDVRNRVATVERVVPGHPMNVHVDEAGNDEAVGGIDHVGPGWSDGSRFNGRYPVAVEDDRTATPESGPATRRRRR